MVFATPITGVVLATVDHGVMPGIGEAVLTPIAQSQATGIQKALSAILTDTP
jgi:hypothetical protein